MANKATIYLDMSVINFLFAEDAPQFQSITKEFFKDFIQKEIYDSKISEIVIREIRETRNEKKRNQLLSVVEEYSLKFADLSKFSEIQNLAQLYVDSRIIPAKKYADALHIAITVVNKLDFLVSWNFQHLANENRERRILALNAQHNYTHPLRIITPLTLMDKGNK